MKIRSAHIKTALAAVGCIAIVMWACSFALRRGIFPWEWEAISRLESPSGKNVLIVMRGNRGALSGFRYAYYVVARGEEAPKSSGWPKDAAFISTGPVPTARWLSDNHLTLGVQRSIFIYAYVPFLDSLQVGLDVSHEGPPKA